MSTGSHMADELITPVNVSIDSLKAILDAAYMETSVDNQGTLRVADRINCCVDLYDEGIRLFAYFGPIKSGTSDLQRLAAVNEMNAQFLIVRASIVTEGVTAAMLFDWHIPTSGGITKKAFVLAVKRFCSIPRDALSEHASDLLQ